VEYAIKSVVRGLGWNVEFGNNVSEGNRKVSKRKCRKCGAEVPEGAKYCIECGKYFEEIEVPMMCPSCGKKALEGAKFCGKCGARMPEAIDLGLSVRWASCNVGTASPEGYGGYYGWADPTGTKTKTKLIYYPSANPPSSISGTKYDIARAKWGGKWRLPTKAEQQELADKCTWTWTTQNGVNGYKVVGKNGNSIFLPAAGYRGGTDVVSVGTRGYYWSGTLNQCNADHAYHLYFYDYGSHDVDRNDRNRGFTVRPVVE
jgi:ribosomal protein L40E